MFIASVIIATKPNHRTTTAYLESEDVIELHLVFLQHSKANEAAQQCITLEQTLGVLGETRDKSTFRNITSNREFWRVIFSVKGVSCDKIR